MTLTKLYELADKRNANIIQRDDGNYRIHNMVDRNGRKAIFYNYKGESFDVGDCVLLKATLTEYRSFDNEPVSYLNRVTVLENKGSIK